MENRFGPRTAEVERMLDAMSRFAVAQWQAMVAVYTRDESWADAQDALAATCSGDAGSRIPDTELGWDAWDAWDAAQDAVDDATFDGTIAAGDRNHDAAPVWISSSVRADAKAAAGCAAQAVVVRDLISTDEYETLTRPFRLACRLPELAEPVQELVVALLPGWSGTIEELIDAAQQLA